MDKSLKRQIGYKKPSIATITAPDKLNKKPPLAAPPAKIAAKPSLRPVPDAQKEVTAKDIVKWLKAHPLFKVAGMCTLVGLDRGNFATKVMAAQDPVIKPEIIKKIVAILKDYGF